MKPRSGEKTSSNHKYQIGITGKNNVIDQIRNKITIPPGQHLMVQTIPRLVKTSNDFNALPRSQRKCKLPYETEGFSYLNQYSRSGCETECALQNALTTCKCIPWYYPNELTILPICEMFGGHCFEEMMSEGPSYKDCKARCLPDCQETAYIVIWSNSSINVRATCKPGGFHYQYFENAITKHFAFEAYKMLVEGVPIDDIKTSFTNGSICQNYVTTYGALVTIESPSTRIISTHRDRRVYFTTKIGTIGGTLGLFVGMSIVSFYELAFLLIALAMGIMRLALMRYKPEINEIDENAKDKLERIQQNVNVSLINICYFKQ